ncbi:molybdenum cofactor synthesis domain protein [Dehalogenimonas lykanthroporepellens BL-DC-9]|jgi:molybdenum cofactor biosynthesis protein B|nr:molybdenum cofactor synthesis domain protein [Dehalogenimonas lykanthroporepellens BL-DC-9]
MGYIDHKEASPTSVSFGIVTVSDSRTEDTDESGRYLTDVLLEHGHSVNGYQLIKNNGEAIHRVIEKFIGHPEIQIIIFTGGTGISHRDLTVETITPLFKKQIPGFGELFRYLTWQEIGTASIMSRAIAGVIDNKVFLCLPGSLNAVKLALESIILPEAGHLIREARR